MSLDPFQADVARIALAAAEGHDFALAGGNALIAHGLVLRVTEDVDLFTSRAGGLGQVTPAVVAALQAAGCEVAVRRASTDGDFSRLVVTRDGRSTELDLARDWRTHPAVRLGVGPVLHLEDAIANKVCAMIGRGLPRDYIDVAGAAASMPREKLLRTAFEHDQGLRVEDVAAALSSSTGSARTTSPATALTKTPSADCARRSSTGRGTSKPTTRAAPRTRRRTHQTPMTWKTLGQGG